MLTSRYQVSRYCVLTRCGTQGLGARPGNKNALKHGRTTAERKAMRKKFAEIDTFIRETLRRVRRIEFRAAEEIRNRAPSNPP
jgi:hypothetical protein